jgi:7-cyano-7-deazaguanine tRNA-ribosyltransferase
VTFEILDRAAAGRLGRLTTPHGTVTTPALMPVLNPNIELVGAREMRERFGCEMVITNSYVLWKHERLRERALREGVHAVLDWDGPTMTDSGTFQSWVYGDVELDPLEIMRFQRDIGVDVATCLDQFVTPDKQRPEAEAMVAETLQRTRDSAALVAAEPGREGTAGAGHRPLVNATVQGGVHSELRQACAAAYRDLPVGYHTIGGVVPLMQDQRYPELVDAILHSQQHLRKDRPVHLFGAGHPLVFPIAAALGCDLFDSSSYAKYAADDRIMTSEGTLHLADVEEFPFGALGNRFTPKELQSLPQKERAREIALHNLDVLFSEVRRVRQAIRDGLLWELVEQRATAHPLLAQATRRLGNPDAQKWLETFEPVSGVRGIRYTGHLSHRRPIFRRIEERLLHRFAPQGEQQAVAASDFAPEGALRIELGMHKEPASKPYASHWGNIDATQDHVVVSALGPVPVGLDEVYPFAQSFLPRLEGLDREHMGWVGRVKDAFLEAHGFVPAIPGPGLRGEQVDRDRMQVLRTADYQFGRGAGAAFTTGAFRVERSPRTDKLRTVHLNGEHVLSLRAHDALFTLKAAGARVLHAALRAPANRVVVHADSVPFNRAGKSVFAQFVLACDEALRPGDECLVVDEQDNLVAVGQVRLNATEMADFQGGSAVKVREGISS